MTTLFTTKEVANYLKINEKKVYQLIKQGSIPCTRVAGKWLFPKEMIDEWIKRSVKTQQDIYIAGSNDPYLDYLISIFTKKNFPNILVFYASIGSAKGLTSLATNKATIAATHLFDPKSGEYNLPFIKKYLNDTPVVVVNFAYREQGFIVQKGNPLQIKEIMDLTKQGIRFINRNPGSGTRLLFDYLIQKAEINSSLIKGYSQELNTHLDVGLHIFSGRADVGLGIKYIAELLDLDFIPITSERFDLVIRKEDFDLHHIQKILSLLDPINTSLYAERFPGYDFKDTGRIIYQDK